MNTAVKESPMSQRSIRAAIALTAAAATLAVPAAASAATVKLDGVRTSLTVAPAITKALVGNGIAPLPVSPATATIVSTKGGPTVRYFFPITSGRVDAGTLAGRINHSGGLWFYGLSSGKSLKLTHFRIVIGKRPALTAIVNGDRAARVRILNLDLSAAAAGALNATFHTELFSRGLVLGKATVLARVAG
jgi:hypothetical protein